MEFLRGQTLLFFKSVLFLLTYKFFPRVASYSLLQREHNSFLEYINYNFINYSHTAAFSLISHNNNYYSNNILSHMVTFFFKIISVWDTSLRVCENADTQDSTFFMALTIFIPNCFPIGNNNLYCHPLRYVFLLTK